MIKTYYLSTCVPTHKEIQNKNKCIAHNNIVYCDNSWNVIFTNCDIVYCDKIWCECMLIVLFIVPNL